MKKELLKMLPKVDELLMEHEIEEYIENYGRQAVATAVRTAVDNVRGEILVGSENEPDKAEIIASALEICRSNDLRNLRRVINATGTILHTNLGRSRLSQKACEAVMDVAKNYSNLEYDTEKGRRGERYDAVTKDLLNLTGAEGCLVVNNNAAAVLLALSAIAKDKRVIVSRGEQVEIGGMFRVPDIMVQSGSHLVEVGTTNKTHLADYADQIDENSVLLKVHTSNYKIIGFTEEVELSELVELGAEHDIPVIYDLGSGSFVDFEKYGLFGEPTVKKAMNDGADIITFSGDKLLGGPQAGIIIGKKKYIDIMKKHPLTRAFRIDKMTIAALEATLKEYFDEERALKNIPVLSQITADKQMLKDKCERLLSVIESSNTGFSLNIIEDKGAIGGGSMPGQFIATYCVEIKSDALSPNLMEERLRSFDTPVVGRIANNALLLDILTIDESDFNYIADCLAKI